MFSFLPCHPVIIVGCRRRWWLRDQLAWIRTVWLALAADLPTPIYSVVVLECGRAVCYEWPEPRPQLRLRHMAIITMGLCEQIRSYLVRNRASSASM